MCAVGAQKEQNKTNIPKSCSERRTKSPDDRPFGDNIPSIERRENRGLPVTSFSVLSEERLTRLIETLIHQPEENPWAIQNRGAAV